jgi:hypothetical protein
MNQSESVINVDVYLHTKVPLIPFLGLVHFPLALADFVFGGTGRKESYCQIWVYDHHAAFLSD